MQRRCSWTLVFYLQLCFQIRSRTEHGFRHPLLGWGLGQNANACAVAVIRQPASPHWQAWGLGGSNLGRSFGERRIASFHREGCEGRRGVRVRVSEGFVRGWGEGRVRRMCG